MYAICESLFASSVIFDSMLATSEAVRGAPKKWKQYTKSVTGDALTTGSPFNNFVQPNWGNRSPQSIFRFGLMRRSRPTESLNCAHLLFDTVLIHFPDRTHRNLARMRTWVLQKVCLSFLPQFITFGYQIRSRWWKNNDWSALGSKGEEPVLRRPRSWSSSTMHFGENQSSMKKTVFRSR